MTGTFSVRELFFKRLFQGSFLAAVILAFFAVRAAADPVPISAAPHDGYGRIVFNWPAPVFFTADLKGRKLSVKFGRPIRASYAGMTKSLAKYVSGVEPSGDGRLLTITLKDNFNLRSFDQGKAVVIDILDVAPDQQAAPQPAKKIEPEAAKKTEPGMAKTSEPGGGAGKDAPVVNVRAGDHKQHTRIIFDWPDRPPYIVQRSGDDAVISFQRPANIEIAGLRSNPPRYVMGVNVERKDDGVTVTFNIPAASEIRHFLSGASVVLDILPPSSSPDAAKAEASGPKPLSPIESAKQEAVAGSPKDLTSTAAAVADGSVNMRFDWDEPVAAAVFRRAGNLWVVFDKPAKIDTAKLRAMGGNLFHGIEQMPSSQATVLRMSTVGGVNPDVKRDGLAWILKFLKQPLKTPEPAEVKAQAVSPIGPRLFIAVGDPGEAIIIKDPEVGDSIVAVPVITLGKGIAAPYEYPQVRILASGQGIAIAPKADAIKISPLNQGISISSEGGIRISPVTAEAAMKASMDDLRPLTRAFNLNDWGNDGLKKIMAKRRKLEKTAAMAKGTDQEKARLDLARFFLANGLAAEALGVIDLLAMEKPEIQNNPEFAAFRGIANFLMNRYADAKKDFQAASLDGNDEGALWFAAAQFAEGDMAEAAGELRRSAALIQPYPRAIKAPLSLLLAEAAIKAGDAKRAELLLTAAKEDKEIPLRKGQIKYMNYLEGALLSLGGDYDGAIGKWETAEEGQSSLSGARAAAARAEKLLELKQITRPEAVEELEKLRFAWRGDDFEFNLLRKLGQLYMEENNYRNGLRTLKQAASYFGKHKKAGEVAKDMTDAFSRLYIGNEADNLEPLTAIALYDEFKELSPVGPKGDEMVRKLADRLVKVDLLDRGAELLETQVKYRLQGAEKAHAGADLALVYIQARKYENSLQSLEDTDISGLEAELADRRRHLKARAMIGMDRGGEALDLLKEDKSIDADLLRSDIFWKAGDWPRAAQSIRRLVLAFNAKPGAPLDEKQSKYVLNMATALALGGNERGLGQARADYGEAMKATPMKDAFDLITSPESQGIIDYRTIASKVGMAEGFQSFIATYNERLKGEKPAGK